MHWFYNPYYDTTPEKKGATGMINILFWWWFNELTHYLFRFSVLYKSAVYIHDPLKFLNIKDKNFDFQSHWFVPDFSRKTGKAANHYCTY